ncbi:DUF3822 family protein [Zunongwangia sp. F363]|uniref:DUF3822 family protein n=1 Tax=Autumnicola tepida TaxID=3075595 RepID=A0ABU3CDJ8_9FLAO|nr:DUF3822 family protein [Zunongwangia sp. F363]MDT0644371.1 DUF3822 family protein [Zunongwangia sp. F363]
MATSNQENNFLKLSIQVSLDGLSFCILNTERKEIIFYRKKVFTAQLDPVKLLQEIETVYKEEPLLSQHINNVILLFSNSLSTLVPSPLFQEENASNYLKFNTKILKTDFIAYDELKEHEMVNVYIPYANVINYFFEKYGEFEYKHTSSILLEELLKLPSQETKMYIYNREKEYDLVVIDDGKLLLCNTFSYETKEDFLYYILFTAEQLNLDPLEFQLLLFGDISKDSDFYEIAYNYIKNIDFLPVFFPFEYHEDTEKPSRESSEFVLLKSL